MHCTHYALYSCTLPSDLAKCERLSWERPGVVAKRIASGGTPSATLHAKGYGFSKPMGNSHDDRRVEVHVLTDQVGMIVV
jgi:hypothetical protein